MREHTSGVLNIFCIKSWIEEHRIHRLDSAVYSARIKSNLVELTTYAPKLHIWFFALDCKISCKSYSELLKHAIDIWLVLKIFVTFLPEKNYIHYWKIACCIFLLVTSRTHHLKILKTPLLLVMNDVTMRAHSRWIFGYMYWTP